MYPSKYSFCIVAVSVYSRLTDMIYADTQVRAREPICDGAKRKKHINLQNIIREIAKWSKGPVKSKTLPK